MFIRRECCSVGGGNKKEFDMVKHGKVVNRFNFVVICTFIFLCISVSSFANQEVAPAETDGAPSVAVTAEAPSAVVVNINTASVEQLLTLPGVGASLAERIIKHRTEVGAFNAPEELMAVQGVGQKKLDKMINMIVVK